MRSSYPNVLRTSDKRIELAPDVLVKDVERVKAKLFDWDRDWEPAGVSPANSFTYELASLQRQSVIDWTTTASQ